jgi:hypothetical protein
MMADDRREVVVTDIRIPFVSMVILLVKWAVAAIPALFILFIIGGLLSMILGLIFGTGWHHWGTGTLM